MSALKKIQCPLQPSAPNQSKEPPPPMFLFCFLQNATLDRLWPRAEESRPRTNAPNVSTLSFDRQRLYLPAKNKLIKFDVRVPPKGRLIDRMFARRVLSPSKSNQTYVSVMKMFEHIGITAFELSCNISKSAATYGCHSSHDLE